MNEPRPAMISALPSERRSRVENSWKTRTGSSELSTETALVRRMRFVRWEAAARTTAGAETAIEGGGMSRLFLATQLDLNRKVVVKVLPPDLTSPATVARFKREIEFTVKLQHPNILPIIAAGAFEDILYYISLYIPGESLR